MYTSLATRLLDFIAPRRCVMCDNRLSPGEEYVCGICQLHIPRTYFHRNPDDNIMCRMFWGQMPAERATAMFFYQPHSQPSRILHRLKYSNCPDIGVVMGRIMANEAVGSDFFNGVDIIMPVPLAKERKKQRGYNQSEMLARGISEITGLPINTKSVIRTKFKESQTRLSRWGRMDNVENIFLFCGTKEHLTGRHILLVDDVATTGATIIACANAMKAVPGIRFSVMTLAFTHS